MGKLCFWIFILKNRFISFKGFYIQRVSEQQKDQTLIYLIQHVFI